VTEPGAGEQGDWERLIEASWWICGRCGAAPGAHAPGGTASSCVYVVPVLAALDVPALRARIAELEAENERLRLRVETADAYIDGKLWDSNVADCAAELEVMTVERNALRAENERLRHRADNPHVACSCALCAMRHERDRLDDLLREANEDGFGWKTRAEVAEAQVKRVRVLHRPWKVLDECDHEHTDEDVRAGRAVDTGWALSCDEALMYVACAECCTKDGEQTEDCATYHNHTNRSGRPEDGPWCPTIAALGEPGSEGDAKLRGNSGAEPGSDSTRPDEGEKR